MDKKQVFIDLLRSIDRPGIEDLIAYLENSDFFEAPASTKYHLSKEGGLVEHSLNVYFNLVKLCNNDYNPDTIKLVALLHDVCKINSYVKSTKNIKNESGVWQPVQTYISEDMLPLGHGEKSVIILLNFINLTKYEIMAIRWHMGGFESKDNYRYLNNAFKQSKLAVWLHMADLKATYLDEID